MQRMPRSARVPARRRPCTSHASPWAVWTRSEAIGDTPAAQRARDPGARDGERAGLLARDGERPGAPAREPAADAHTGDRLRGAQLEPAPGHDDRPAAQARK